MAIDGGTHTKVVCVCVCEQNLRTLNGGRVCGERDAQYFFTSNQRWCHPENQKKDISYDFGVGSSWTNRLTWSLREPCAILRTFFLFFFSVDRRGTLEWLPLIGDVWCV